LFKDGKIDEAEKSKLEMEEIQRNDRLLRTD